MTIVEISDSVTEAIDSNIIPGTLIPLQLLYKGSISKPGLSPMRIASSIISRQSDVGAPYGPMKDGTANIAEAMEVVRVEEIVKAIQENGMVQISIPPGAITFSGMGENAAGPVPVTGSNVNFVSGIGTLI